MYVTNFECCSLLLYDAALVSIKVPTVRRVELPQLLWIVHLQIDSSTPRTELKIRYESIIILKKTFFCQNGAIFNLDTLLI
jgi:hypothetical protein